jgi:hypothetical protein
LTLDVAEWNFGADAADAGAAKVRMAAMDANATSVVLRTMILIMMPP